MAISRSDMNRQLYDKGGIITLEDAKKMANSGCNGVIVGSAFVKYIQDNIENKDLPQSLGNLVKNFTEELK